MEKDFFRVMLDSFPLIILSPVKRNDPGETLAAVEQDSLIGIIPADWGCIVLDQLTKGFFICRI